MTTDAGAREAGLRDACEDLRMLLAAAEAREAQLRQALTEVSNAYGCFAGCTGALPGAPLDDSGHSSACEQARAALASPPVPPEDTQENRYAFYRAAWKDAETRADQHLDLALRNLRRAQAAEARAETQENAASDERACWRALSAAASAVAESHDAEAEYRARVEFTEIWHQLLNAAPVAGEGDES